MDETYFDKNTTRINELAQQMADNSAALQNPVYSQLRTEYTALLKRCHQLENQISEMSGYLADEYEANHALQNRIDELECKLAMSKQEKRLARKMAATIPRDNRRDVKSKAIAVSEYKKAMREFTEASEALKNILEQNPLLDIDKIIELMRQR